MKTIVKGGLCALGLVCAAGAASADTYIRKGDQDISVTQKGGLLYCTRVSDGYELCNGMAQGDDGAWRGKKMKHPDMPGFMRFNGTVIIGANALKIKGCAVGMCDSEVWAKKP